jgi:enoyl-CoA hydratase/carnithine racemase
MHVTWHLPPGVRPRVANISEEDAVLVPRLEDYKDKYKHAKLEREDGILQVTLHSNGKELVWGFGPHEECGYLWEDIARDRENKVVILTGSGDNFIHKEELGGGTVTPEFWQNLQFNGKRLLMSHLDIEAPMIAAINGPATVHAELALLCDIVLAADHTVFGDAPHAPNGLVPGDGVQIVWPLLLGFNRGRYFLLTGQEISAQQAQELGVVNEVLPKADLLPRAWELARMLRGRPEVALGFTRTAMVHQLKRILHDNLGYGLSMEGLAGISYWPS